MINRATKLFINKVFLMTSFTLFARATKYSNKRLIDFLYNILPINGGILLTYVI